jgi:DNA polymerase-1
MQQAIASARRVGYATTLAGRRRSIADIRSQNRTLRSAAERIAINSPIQGTAADLLKEAMLRIARDLAGLRATLLLQVHDELVLEVPPEEEREVEALVRDHMTGVATLAVPLVVDTGWGTRWSDAH